MASRCPVRFHRSTVAPMGGSRRPPSRPRFRDLLALAALAAALGTAPRIALADPIVPAAANRTRLSLARGSQEAVFSADGRHVAFVSGSDLGFPTGDDPEGDLDVFRLDLQTGDLRLVSHAAGSTTVGGAGDSGFPRISADARYVLYVSGAPDLVASSPPSPQGHLFLWDATTGANTLVDHRWDSSTTPASGSVLDYELAASVPVVVFVSDAADLIQGYTGGGAQDLFRFDLSTGQVSLVSAEPGSTVAGTGAAFEPQVSADGQVVAYLSRAVNLVAGGTDLNGNDPDVFVHLVSSGINRLVSHAASSTTTSGDWPTWEFRLATGGGTIVYSTDASNIDPPFPGAMPGANQVYRYSVGSQTNTLVSDAASGLDYGNGASDLARVVADGSRTFFRTDGTDVTTPAFSPASSELVVHDVATGTTTLLTHAPGMANTASQAQLADFEISSDGSVIGLRAQADELVPGVLPHSGLQGDAVLWRSSSDAFSLLSYEAGVVDLPIRDYVGPVVVSGDGSRVGFETASRAASATGVDANGVNDFYRVDVASGQRRLLVSSPGRFDRTGEGSELSDRWSWTSSSISREGRWLTFASQAPGLLPGVDGRGWAQVFLLELDTGELRLVSHADGSTTTGGNGSSFGPIVSGDGRWVLFSSDAPDLVAGQTGATSTNVFLWDAEDGTTRLVSHLQGQPATGSGGSPSHPSISFDGEVAAFMSASADLGIGADANGTEDVFLFRRSTGVLERASTVAATGDAGNGASVGPIVAADGSALFFSSLATDLVPGVSDTNGGHDVLRVDLATGTPSYVSLAASSSDAAAQESVLTDVSADGDWVAFASRAGDLIGGITSNDREDCYLHRISSGDRILVSHQAGDPSIEGNLASTCIGLSPDGGWVALESEATDLIVGTDTNGAKDVFLYDRTADEMGLVSRASASATAACDAESSGSAVVTDVGSVLFRSGCSDLVAGQDGGTGNLFRADRQGIRGGGPIFDLELITHWPGDETAGRGEHPTAATDRARDWAMDASGERAVFDAETPVFQGLFPETEVFVHGPDLDADLVVVAADRSDPVELGSPVIDDVVVTNDGPGWAAGVEVELVLPEGSTASFTGTGWACWDDGIRAACLHPLLASGASSVLTVELTDLSQVGTVELLASAFHSGPDPDDSDDSDAETTTIADTTPPVNPALGSTSHTVSTWSTDRTVTVAWTEATDSGVGVAGYSVVFDQNPATEPDETPEILASPVPGAIVTADSAPLVDGNSHWFHLRTCDLEGNCAAASHLGPFWIDGSAPSTPLLGSSSHDQPSQDPTIDVVWSPSVDPHSGLAGYEIEWSASAAPGACGPTTNLGAGATSAISPSFSEGSWYVHLCAVDALGNWSAAGTGGPYVVDQTPPEVVAIDASPSPGSTGLGGPLGVFTPMSQILVRFDEPMDNPSGGRGPSPPFLLVAPGTDGTLESTSCVLAPTDQEVIVGNAIPAQDSTAVALSELGFQEHLPRGSYRLFVCDALTDPAGNALDGDGDGAAGGHRAVDFFVETTNLLSNPYLDQFGDLSGWSYRGDSSAALFWDVDDADDSGFSGSMEITGTSGSWVAAEQCIPVGAAAERYRLASRVRIGGAAAAEPSVRLEVEVFADASCQGPTPLESAFTGDLVGQSPGGVWEVLGGIWEPGSVGASIRFSVEVEPGPGQLIDVAVDHLFLGEDFGIFADGFESGDASAWGP